MDWVLSDNQRLVDINRDLEDRLANCNSDLISQQIDTLDKKYYSSIKYAKGHYFKYRGSHPFTTLVYPLASEFSSGLHVGFDLSGQIRFGPDITWVDNIDYSFDDSLKDNFMSSIKKYWPGIDSKKLQPDYVSIRPKLQNMDEKMKEQLELNPFPTKKSEKTLIEPLVLLFFLLHHYQTLIQSL